MKDIHSGGGGRTSSPPLVIDRLRRVGVELLFKARPRAMADESPSRLLNSSIRTSWEDVGGDLRSGGALCDLVGRCLGLDLQVFTGGERRLLSTVVGVRMRLLGVEGGVIKSLSLVGDSTLEASWSASLSISVSRVTMIGVRGRRERRPKTNSFDSGYMGIGETRTVRSVMMVNSWVAGPVCAINPWTLIVASGQPLAVRRLPVKMLSHVLTTDEHVYIKIGGERRYGDGRGRWAWSNLSSSPSPCTTSTIHMVELPTELWLRIAYFVADVDLYRLTSVNRLFFDLAMDRRYKQLVIDHDRPLALINKLSRLE